MRYFRPLVTKVTVKIPAGQAKTYDAYIGVGALEGLGDILSAQTESSRVTLISNSDIWGFVGNAVDASLKNCNVTFDLVEIPEGEAFKTIETCEAVFESLTEFGAGRKDPIVAVGGGVIGDLAGFTAATYMRGVPFVNVPTTLLAQVDSSIGGKTGVDLPAGKNLVGAFNQPIAVVIDTALLTTLPNREVRSGIAEIIKCGMLAGGKFLSFLDSNIEGLKKKDKSALTQAVVLSVGFKAEVVGADEKDLTGRRAILNYGHTFGHALEAALGYTELNHGEAVAAGLKFAANLGAKLGVGSKAITDATDRLLSKAGFGLTKEAVDVAGSGLIDAMRLDKKNTRQKISFVLLEDFGRPVIREVEETTIVETIKEIYG